MSQRCFAVGSGDLTERRPWLGSWMHVAGKVVVGTT